MWKAEEMLALSLRISSLKSAFILELKENRRESMWTVSQKKCFEVLVLNVKGTVSREMQHQFSHKSAFLEHLSALHFFSEY